MEFIKTSSLSESQKEEILELWNNEYPEQLNYTSLAEFEDYLKNLSDQSHILVIDENQNIKGWYFDFTRDDEKWFAILLDAEFQGKGLGKQVLNLAKEKEAELNGWVVDHHNDLKRNGDVYKSPLGFYIHNGFDVLTSTRLEIEKISAVKIKWKKE